MDVLLDRLLQLTCPTFMGRLQCAAGHPATITRAPCMLDVCINVNGHFPDIQVFVDNDLVYEENLLQCCLCQSEVFCHYYFTAPLGLLSSVIHGITDWFRFKWLTLDFNWPWSEDILFERCCLLSPKSFYIACSPFYWYGLVSWQIGTISKLQRYSVSNTWSVYKGSWFSISCNLCTFGLSTVTSVNMIWLTIQIQLLLFSSSC